MSSYREKEHRFILNLYLVREKLLRCNFFYHVKNLIYKKITPHKIGSLLVFGISKFEIDLCWLCYGENSSCG